MACRARRELDELVCHSCKLRWDANDPEPPVCRPGHKATPQENMQEIRRLLDAPTAQPGNQKKES